MTLLCLEWWLITEQYCSCHYSHHSFALFLCWLRKSLLISWTQCVIVAQDKLTVIRTVYFSRQISCTIQCEHFLMNSPSETGLLPLTYKWTSRLTCLQCWGTITELFSENILLQLKPPFQSCHFFSQRSDIVFLYFYLCFKL